MDKRVIFIFVLSFLVVIGGILYTVLYAPQSGKLQTASKMYCNSDADCVCGIDKATKACAYGNKKYISTDDECPDFCTGIDGNLTITCEANTCIQRSQ